MYAFSRCETLGSFLSSPFSFLSSTRHLRCHPPFLFLSPPHLQRCHPRHHRCLPRVGGDPGDQSRHRGQSIGVQRSFRLRDLVCTPGSPPTRGRQRLGVGRQPWGRGDNGVGKTSPMPSSKALPKLPRRCPPETTEGGRGIQKLAR